MVNNLSNTAMNGQTKFKETVKYKGDLRIVGIVINADKKTLGYVIMTEKNQQFKMYTEAQTKVLLRKFKFVNAELDGDFIKNTECAMNKLMQFNTNMQVVGNHGVTVLAKISVNGKQYGYRAMDHNGKIVDLTEAEVIKLKEFGTELINAKVVSKNGKEFVSAIKGEFTQIDKQSIADIKNKSDSKESNWRKAKRRDKLERVWCHTILRKSIVAHAGSWFPYWAMTYRQPVYPDIKADYNFGKTIEIMAKEIVPKHIKTEEHKRVLKKLLDKYLSVTDKHVYPSKKIENVMLAVGLAQFVLIDNPELENRILSKPKELLNKSIYNDLYELGLTIHEYEGLVLKMEKAYADEPNKKKVSRTEFKTASFKTAKDCAQIGFAINAKDKGFKYTTEAGSNYTLKYVGDYLGNYTTYKKMARCLGDVLVLAQIERLQKVNYFTPEQKLIREEIMLAIMSLYRPDIVNTYISNNFNRYIDLGMLPGLNLESMTDYDLSPELKIYYESGFNVFLNDTGMSGSAERNKYNMRKYKRHYLKYSDYINLRSLGAGVKSLHTMLYDELAAIVGMITSDRVTPEAINEVIGALRML